jgi:hypothetical protein
LTIVILTLGLNAARFGSIGVVAAVLVKQPCEVQVCTIPRAGGWLQPTKIKHRAQTKNSLIKFVSGAGKIPFGRVASGRR